MSDPTVLVTGATGFLGSHVVAHLVLQGWRVTVLARSTSSWRWLEGLPVQRLEGDVAVSVPPLEGFDAVVHAAGAVKALDLEAFRRVNVLGTRRVLEAAVAGGVRRFVQVSSMAVTGPAPGTAPLTESEPSAPGTDYGRSKREAEDLARGFADRLEVVALRPGPIYGPRDTEMLGLFRAATWGVLPAFAGASQVLNLVHVSDVAEAVERALLAPVPTGSAFLVGGARSYDMGQIGRIFGQAAGREGVRLLTVPRPVLWSLAGASELGSRILGRPAMFSRQKVPDLCASWRPSLAAARDGLGWEPRVDLPQGVASTLAWYREQGWIRP